MTRARNKPRSHRDVLQQYDQVPVDQFEYSPRWIKIQKEIGESRHLPVQECCQAPIFRAPGRHLWRSEQAELKLHTHDCQCSFLTHHALETKNIIIIYYYTHQEFLTSLHRYGNYKIVEN